MKTTDTTPRPQSLAQRITQGPIASRDKTSQPIQLHNIAEPAKVVANVYGNSETFEANAELITEAFNVTHETGKTPRQLADERQELIECLKLFMGNVKREVIVADPHRLTEARNTITHISETLARLTP